MNVTIYYENGKREYISLVNQILERDNDYSITYCDLNVDAWRSIIANKIDVNRITVKGDL